jgi:hypothetical protein
MAKIDLLKALDAILSDAGTQTQKFHQANRNITTTEVLRSDVKAIIKSWYYGLAKGDLNHNEGAVAKPTAVTMDKRWAHSDMVHVTEGAIDAYIGAVTNAVTSHPDLQMGPAPPSGSGGISWIFYGDRGSGVGASTVDKKVNQTAMTALKEYIDTNWKGAELSAITSLKKEGSHNKASLYNEKTNDASGYTNVTYSAGGLKKSSAKGGISTYSVFGHGVPEEDPKYGSTYYAVRILEDIIRNEKTQTLGLKNANPILKQFSEDLYELFTIDAGIQISAGKGGQSDIFSAHKDVIEIKGQIIPKTKQGQMKRWDKAKKTQINKAATEGIQKELFDRIDKAFGEIAADIASGKQIYKGYTLADLGASPSPRQKIGRKAVHSVVKQLKKANPNAKIILKTPKPRRTSKVSAKKKAPVTKKKPVSKRKTIQAKKATVTKRKKSTRAFKTDTGATRNPLALKNLLQKALPDEIAAKMTGGRTLMYRTGRFSDSAEIINVAPFPRSIEIQYSYMKNPYQVFEPESGSTLASRGRDPRAIIGSTIRELAQTLMGDRFLIRTKRV